MIWHQLLVYSARYVLQVLHTVPENDPVQLANIQHHRFKETRIRTKQFNLRLNLFANGAQLHRQTLISTT